jgi:hypothetical protein
MDPRSRGADSDAPQSATSGASRGCPRRPLSASPHYTIGTSDFDAQMTGIEIEKGNEFLRPVCKKPFPEILSGCCILDFLGHATMRCNLFFFD